MIAFGNGLVPSPPPRPPDHVLLAGQPAPHEPPEQASDLWDGEREQQCHLWCRSLHVRAFFCARGPAIAMARITVK
jgi:hypothetical protein